MNNKAKREGMRWQIINALNKARPYPTSEVFLIEIMQSIYGEVTNLELRQQLDYLEDRDVLSIDKKPYGLWFADLTRIGIDIAEYTISCEAGIARPEKYWSE